MHSNIAKDKNLLSTLSFSYEFLLLIEDEVNLKLTLNLVNQFGVVTKIWKYLLSFFHLASNQFIITR